MRKRSVVWALGVCLIILALSGCAVGQSAQPKTEEPKNVDHTGSILAVSGDTLSVYVFAGYQGEMVVRITQSTSVEASLKPLLKPGTLITFITDGTATKSEPPQVTALAIQSATEAVTFRGRVTEVADGRISVSTTHPQRDVVCVRVGEQIWKAPGVVSQFEVGNTVEFEVSPIMQPSEPGQFQMLRLLKNEPRLVQHTGTCVGVEGNVIKVQTPETTEIVEVAHPILVRNLRQGDRVVVLAATRGGVHTLVQLRHLPPDATIVGHFAYLEHVRNDRIRAVLMNEGVLEVLKDSITLPVDLGSGRLMYMEYRVDKVGEYNALRKIEVLYSDDEVIQAALDATYMIETEAITLVSGRSEKLVMPGSAMTVKTHAWNSPVLGHLDSDGHVDAVLVLVHQTDGSGVFFYAVAMYWDAEKCAYVGTNGVFLGDRIDPQNITVDSGVVTVDYIERKPGEPMTAQPSVGTVKRLVLADGVLRE